MRRYREGTPVKKATTWTDTDTEVQKRGEQTGFDTPGSPARRKRCRLAVGILGDLSGAANAISRPPGE